eukprot:2494748-Pleurochrysis_carterae.AAC.1
MGSQLSRSHAQTARWRMLPHAHALAQDCANFSACVRVRGHLKLAPQFGHMSRTHARTLSLIHI